MLSSSNHFGTNTYFFRLFWRNNDRGKRVWENTDLFQDFFSAKFQKAISRHEIVVVNCEKSISKLVYLTGNKGGKW